MEVLASSMKHIDEFFNLSRYALRDPAVYCADLVLGNPQDFPIPQLVKSLQNSCVPTTPSSYGYQTCVAEARSAISKKLYVKTGVIFDESDIFLTPGGTGAIQTALSSFVEAGDEVIYFSPPWYWYESMILGVGGTPVAIYLESPDFTINIADLIDKLSIKTRMVIINTPNNPTGQVYGPSILKKIGQILKDYSDKVDREIYILSDEAYREVIMPPYKFTSPSAYYENTLVAYSYAKTILSPGIRLGYLAIPSTCPSKKEKGNVIFKNQLIQGYNFPTALLQYALPEIEMLTFDIDQLTSKMDYICTALTEAGYTINRPEGTFYVLVKVPGGEAGENSFVDQLADLNTYVLPGYLFDLKGYVRLSLTATPDMLKMAVEAFKRIMTLSLTSISSVETR